MVFVVKDKAQADTLCAIAALNEYTIQNVKHIRINNCTVSKNSVVLSGNEEDYYELEVTE